MSAALGIDIGGSGVKLALVEAEGRVAASARLPTAAAGGTAEGLVAAIAEAAAGLGPQAGRAGVSVAGFLDAAHEGLAYNPNLAFLEGVPLRGALSRALALPVRLEVDSNAQGLAEQRFGAGRGARRLAFYTLGTGVGGSLIWDGAPLRFCGECAGDMGHMMLDPEGPPCGCGARGCLEAFLGRERVEAEAGRPVPELIAAAEAGEGAARGVLAALGARLGQALAATVQLYGPDRYVIGGGLSLAGEALLAPARARFAALVPPGFRGIPILPAAFGSFGGAIGATIEPGA